MPFFSFIKINVVVSVLVDTVEVLRIQITVPVQGSVGKYWLSWAFPYTKCCCRVYDNTSEPGEPRITNTPITAQQPHTQEGG